MRVPWPQLQSLQQQVEIMVGSGGAWLHCVRGLTTARAAAGPKLALGAGSSALESLNECLVRSECSGFRRVNRWIGGLGYLSASRQASTTAMQCNSGSFWGVVANVSASKVSTVGGKGVRSLLSENSLSGRGTRGKAKLFSTFSVDELNSTATLPVETSVSTETTVTETEAGTIITESEVSVEEFVPGTESVPATSLVEAIVESQNEQVAAEEPVPSKPKLTGSLDEFFASLPPPPNRTASLLAQNSNRVIEPGRLYIGGLPFSVKGDELISGLQDMCSKYGKVQNVVLAQHRHQSPSSIAEGKHKGFAFVTMSSAKEAEEVVEKMNGVSAWGRVIMVSFALRKVEPDRVDQVFLRGTPAQRCKVFVGNLHEGTTSQTLENTFEKFGTIKDLKLICEVHTNKSRGFGFVTFASEDQAMKAILDLDGTTLDGSVIRVNIAKYPQTF